MENLTFNSETHEYKLDDKIVPSVTQIIQAVLPTNFYVSQEMLDYKADIGRKVHYATELYDQDNLDIDSLHPTLKGYLDGWIRCIRDFKLKPIAIELQLAHSVYRFAGTVDRVFEGNILIDIKTGVPKKTDAIQTAGYAELWNYDKGVKDKIRKRMSVYLKDDNYKIIEHKDKTDRQIFLACLTIYNFTGGDRNGTGK